MSRYDNIKQGNVSGSKDMKMYEIKNELTNEQEEELRRLALRRLNGEGRSISHEVDSS